MPDITFTLDQYDLIKCHGEDAETFLQGQITSDLTKLKEHKAQLSCCCNLQGRVIVIFSVIKLKDGFGIIIHQSMADLLVKHLSKYIIMAKVTLEKSSERIMGVVTDTPSDDMFSCHDNRYFKLSSESTDKSFSDWHLLNIKANIPEIYPETSEQFVAQRLGLHLMDGCLSFNKGCYVGQEVIARIHFKGTVKHKLCYASVNLKQLSYDDVINDEKGSKSGELVDFETIDEATHLVFVAKISDLDKKLLIRHNFLDIS